MVQHSSGESSLDREPSSTSVIDVLDHVMDKGIVIDPWVVLSLPEDDLASRHAHLVVASVSTYRPRDTRTRPLAGGGRSQVEPACSERQSLEYQLQRIRDQMDRHEFDPQRHRRAEDRVLDELRDAQARTVPH